MKRFIALAIIALLPAAALTSTAQAETQVHRVTMDAIHHNHKICPKIEWAVYLDGFDKAEHAFVQEWRELGYNKQVSGVGVFEELVARCAELR